ncbi:MAG: hypothetical protein LW636_11335 [Planctomycetaceae bacterium]|nr:hypothetical protein [Planctomycetaceae bacterium]
MPLVETVHPSVEGEAPPEADIAKVDAELRGLGAAAKQSAELLFVSTMPAPRRNTAVVLEGAAAAVPEFAFSKQLAVDPKPILSTRIEFRLAQVFVEPDCDAVINAMLPAVPLMFTEPVASGVGRADPTAPPAN